jgi:hypothetical protein
MNTPIKIRIAALAASILVTLATVYLISDYALPEAAAVQLASAAH